MTLISSLRSNLIYLISFRIISSHIITHSTPRYTKVMKERHTSELIEYQKLLLGKQTRPKFSKDLLNLRKIQDTLAKQKE